MIFLLISNIAMMFCLPSNFPDLALSWSSVVTRGDRNDRSCSGSTAPCSRCHCCLGGETFPSAVPRYWKTQACGTLGRCLYFSKNDEDLVAHDIFLGFWCDQRVSTSSQPRKINIKGSIRFRPRLHLKNDQEFWASQMLGVARLGYTKYAATEYGILWHIHILIEVLMKYVLVFALFLFLHAHFRRSTIAGLRCKWICLHGLQYAEVCKYGKATNNFIAVLSRWKAVSVSPGGMLYLNF